MTVGQLRTAGWVGLAVAVVGLAMTVAGYHADGAVPWPAWIAALLGGAVFAGSRAGDSAPAPSDGRGRPGPWARLVAFLDRREAATGLALFRIVLAACVLELLGEMVWDGLVVPVWIDKAYGGYRSLGHGPWLVALLGGPTPTVVWGLVGAGFVAATLMLVGAGGRWPVLGTLLVLSSLTYINNQATGAYDDLADNALWILFLSRSTATLSFDARWRTGRWTSDEPVPAWPRWLAIFQIVLCYWTTGLQKVSAYWVPGGGFSALYYILQQPTWHRFDMRWVAWFYPLTQIGTGVTWFWEVGAPLLWLAFWYRHTRTRPGRLRATFNAVDFRFWYMAIGCFFHGSLLVLMNVGPFSPISMAYYLCLYSPDEYRALARRWWPRGAPQPEAATEPAPAPVP